MDDSTRPRIETLIGSSPIFVFMKGNKLMPQCGFSNNVVQILHSMGVSFETFDVLSDMEIRQGIRNFPVGQRFLRSTSRANSWADQTS